MEITVRNVPEERRKYINGKMLAEPLTYPYANFDAMKNRSPLEVRYTTSMDILKADDLESIGLSRDHLPEILLARWKAGKYIINQFTEKGISYMDVSEMCKVSPSLISKIAKGDRPLAFEASALVPLCLNVLYESCNKVMFGYDGEIVLPGIYSQIAKLFSRCSEKDRKEILNRSNAIRKRFDLLSPAVNGAGMHRDPDELIRTRLWDLSYASGANVLDFFSEKQPRRIHNNIRAYFENAEAYRPRMSFTMFLAIETGYALDYFIVEDFTLHTPCFYMDGDEKVEIKDRDMLQFIGNVFAVDKETSVKMTAPLYAECICAE